MNSWQQYLKKSMWKWGAVLASMVSKKLGLELDNKNFPILDLFKNFDSLIYQFIKQFLSKNISRSQKFHSKKNLFIEKLIHEGALVSNLELQYKFVLKYLKGHEWDFDMRETKNFSLNKFYEKFYQKKMNKE